MSSDYDDNLLKEAIYHVKSGDHETARRYLQRALDVADDLITRSKASFYLAEISRDAAEKRNYLEDVLAIEPAHPQARRALAILNGTLKPDEIVNPDNLPAQSSDPQQVQADRFTCPKCGGKMVFDGDGQSLICEYCARNETPTQAAGAEQDFIVAMASGKGHRTPVAMQVFACKGCGAQFILPPQVISESCAYCGSPHVVSQGQRDLIAPDVILPIKFNQHQAALHLVKWVKKIKLEPQGQVQAPRGVYLPIWTFDISGNIPWDGVIEKKNKTEPVSGVYPVFVNDMPVPAASHLPELLIKLLPEYDFSTAPAYDARYLAGWPAEVYETSMSDASLQARQELIPKLRRTIERDFYNITNLKYNTSNVFISSFKLALVPIWLTEIPYEGQNLPVAINGSTGQVHGHDPNQNILNRLGNWLKGE